MLIGSFFLLPKLNIEGLEFISQNGWGIALIVLGIIVICKAIWHRQFRKHYYYFWPQFHWHTEWNSNHAQNSAKAEPGYIVRDCIFGNINEKIDLANFKGGDIDGVFSNAEIDLSDAQLAEGVNYLKIDMVFGNVVIYAPIDWKIEIREDSVFGKFIDNRPKPEFETDTNKTLIISIDTVFGGGEIRCR